MQTRILVQRSFAKARLTFSWEPHGAADSITLGDTAGLNAISSLEWQVQYHPTLPSRERSEYQVVNQTGGSIPSRRLTSWVIGGGPSGATGGHWHLQSECWNDHGFASKTGGVILGSSDNSSGPLTLPGPAISR